MSSCTCRGTDSRGSRVATSSNRPSLTCCHWRMATSHVCLHIRSSACKLYFSIAGIAHCNVFHDGVVSFPLLEARMPPYVGFAPFISHHNKFVFFTHRHFDEREKESSAPWVGSGIHLDLYRYTIPRQLLSVHSVLPPHTASPTNNSYLFVKSIGVIWEMGFMSSDSDYVADHQRCVAQPVEC